MRNSSFPPCCASEKYPVTSLGSLTAPATVTDKLASGSKELGASQEDERDHATHVAGHARQLGNWDLEVRFLV